MRFIIAVNSGDEEGESTTLNVVDTESDCRRTNKRKLREYFKVMGVKPFEMKMVFRAMGFTGEALGK